MSTADPVPETWELTGDDARDTLRRTGVGTLLRDSFARFRVSDGFSHARSLAYLTTMVFLQGVIALVGLASVVSKGGVSSVIVTTLQSAVPGPASSALSDAVKQAHRAGSSHRYLALALGLSAAVITGTTLMGQVERALNRIYGTEQDRPTLSKYVHAFALAITAGVLVMLAFAALALGRDIGSSLTSHPISTVWAIIRWPFALLALAAGMALVFRFAPRRRQPAWSWLMFGAAISVTLLLIVTVGLDWMFRLSSTFGKTYGPLASIVALMLWALLSSIAVLLGAAVAAQLEAVRAGRPAPQSDEKVRTSEPAVQPLATAER
jgi:YihY family inner membrane protein